MSTSTKNLEAALRYHKMGLPLVLVRENSKAPLQQNWVTRELDAETLNSEYETKPNLNIGVRLGNASTYGLATSDFPGLIDIDLDSNKAQEDLYDLFEGHNLVGIFMQTPNWQATRGAHLLFQWDERFADFPAKVEWGDVELRLNVGGQTIFPPSITGGKERKWKVELNSLKDVPKLPEDVIERILQDCKPTKSVSDFRPVGIGASVSANPFLAGSDYDATGPDWEDILGEAGWTVCKVFPSGVRWWTKPGGRKKDVHATTGAVGSRGGDKFFPFTTDCKPFKANYSYSKFAALTTLKFDGDYAKCHTHLRELGFGSALSLLQARGRTELANSQRLVEKYGCTFRYIAASKVFRVFNGHVWEDDSLDKMMSYAVEIVDGLWQEYHHHEDLYNKDLDAKSNLSEKEKERDRAVGGLIKLAMASVEADRKKILEKCKSFILTSSRETPLRAAINLTRREVSRRSEDWNLDPYVLNFQNGVVNLKTGEFTSHDSGKTRELYLTSVVPLNYDPHATCPKFLELMEIVLPDDELRTFASRGFGYSVNGDIGEQLVFLFLGGGNNGKTTLFDAVRNALGHLYCIEANEGLIEARAQKEHATELARLEGRRIVIAGEMAQMAELNTVRLKFMTRDIIVARVMNGNFYHFPNVSTLFMDQNHLPLIRQTDEGTHRRLAIVNCDVDVPKRLEELGKERILNYGRLIGLEEAAGICTQLVRWSVEYHENGLSRPSRVDAAGEEYRKDADYMADFFEDCTIKAEGAKTHLKELQIVFSKWAEVNRAPRLGRNTLSNEVNKVFEKDSDRDGTFFYGFKLKVYRDDGAEDKY